MVVLHAGTTRPGVSIAAPRAFAAVDENGDPLIPDRAEPRRPTEDEGHTRRPLLLAVGAVGLVLVLIGIYQLRPSSGHRTPDDGRAVARSPKPTVSSTATTMTASSTLPSSRQPPPTWRPDCRSSPDQPADIDGDGCPDPVGIEAENVVAAGTRYAVGQAGDEVALGDWDCDGRATPAVLRPATGEVFVFPSWATRQQPVVTRSTATVPGATAIIGPDGGGPGACGRLVVRTTAGRAVTVTTTTATATTAAP